MSAILDVVDLMDPHRGDREVLRAFARLAREQRSWRVSADAVSVQMARFPDGEKLDFFEDGANLERFHLSGQPAYPYAEPHFHKIDSPFGRLFVLDYRSRYWLMDGDLIEIFGMVLKTQSERDFLLRLVRRNWVRFAGRNAHGAVCFTDAGQQVRGKAVDFFDQEAVLSLADLLYRFRPDWPSVPLVRSWVCCNGIAKAVAAAAKGGAK